MKKAVTTKRQKLKLLEIVKYALFLQVWRRITHIHSLLHD